MAMAQSDSFCRALCGMRCEIRAVDFVATTRI